MKRFIEVSGRGEVRAKPDYVSVDLTFKEKEKSYDVAFGKVAEVERKLVEALSTIGLSAEHIKTKSFCVEPQFECNCMHDSSRRREFAGYEVSHELNLGFEFDSEMLRRVLETMVGSDAMPEMSLEFCCKDVEAFYHKALELSVADAKHKAEVICAATGCSLGDVLSVSGNGVGRRDFPILRWGAYRFSDELCGGVPEINPQDMMLSASVTVKWAIR